VQEVSSETDPDDFGLDDGFVVPAELVDDPDDFGLDDGFVVPAELVDQAPTELISAILIAHPFATRLLGLRKTDRGYNVVVELDREDDAQVVAKVEIVL
jgi:hypothetical protein